MRDAMRGGMGNGACPMCRQEPCACEGESEMEGGEEEGYGSSEGDSEPEEGGEMDVEALKQEAISTLFDKGTDDMMKKEIAGALADGDFEHVKMLLSHREGPMKKPKGIAVMIGVK